MKFLRSASQVIQSRRLSKVLYLQHAGAGVFEALFIISSVFHRCPLNVYLYLEQGNKLQTQPGDGQTFTRLQHLPFVIGYNTERLRVNRNERFPSFSFFFKNCLIWCLLPLSFQQRTLPALSTAKPSGLINPPRPALKHAQKTTHTHTQRTYERKSFVGLGAIVV